ncbi:MAG TPA: TetR/AcrR family transcriptional regulator [Lachnoclostridium sp.]|jgi:AcrR family transcriptional regulator|uniref:TetR/AcrR family transcriptional regulator n=1 Tax=Lacrimispora sp. TaxID=2719234 RepID=UPI000EBFFFCD|nr:TetR/AcrR family transcriptional regulator [Lacrimispora sp.]HCD43410.1 TetR/AcrR family transcriptional regulator [Lachnoclostridium sp.]
MKDTKTDLFNCGKELFSRKGFKDTNVSDITKSVGIGTGTFYNYYSSKEELFMAIYMEENEKLKKKILKSIDLDQDPRSLVKELMLLNLKGMKSNPILKEWYNKDVFDKIEQHFREDKGMERLDFMYNDFSEIIKKWQADGKMRNDIDSGMIMAIFTAIVTIETHKEEIGLQYFPQILDYLTEFTMNGLAGGGTQSGD